jgi:hypothetical protein
MLEHEELQTVKVNQINLFLAQPAIHARTPEGKSGLVRSIALRSRR